MSERGNGNADSEYTLTLTDMRDIFARHFGAAYRLAKRRSFPRSFITKYFRGQKIRGKRALLWEQWIKEEAAQLLREERGE